jgi:ubiquinone/menaquinone biosynthesis C-methylase UbiE
MPALTTRINRNLRSVLSLNRGKEFSTLVSMLRLEPTDRLLDVGSGDGYWTIRFAKHVAEAVGLEPSGDLVQHSQNLHGAPNVRYEEGFGESLPFPDATFDKVVSVSSVEHFRDPALGLAEMYRVLKPGGRLAISVDTLIPENSSADFREWHSDRYSVTTYFHEDEMKTMLEDIGFTVTDDPVVHLFQSGIARSSRETFIRHPKPLLPLYPAFRGLVAVGDARGHGHGQIIVLAAERPAPSTSAPAGSGT